jgi:hypothetical protein
MPTPTIPAKIAINFILITFFRIMNSGKDNAVTDIMKARVVQLA